MSEASGGGGRHEYGAECSWKTRQPKGPALKTTLPNIRRPGRANRQARMNARSKVYRV